MSGNVKKEFGDYQTPLDFCYRVCNYIKENSKTVQEFLLSIAFLDNKRPYTVKLLSRLDIQKCLEAVPFEGLRQTEADLKLPQKITEAMYRNLAQFVREQA